MRCEQACQKGNAKLVKWLVGEGGSDGATVVAQLLATPDNDGNLPCDCARLEGHGDLAAWLEELSGHRRGASVLSEGDVRHEVGVSLLWA